MSEAEGGKPMSLPSIGWGGFFYGGLAARDASHLQDIISIRVLRVIRGLFFIANCSKPLVRLLSMRF
jgi:hypothetical protein